MRRRTFDRAIVDSSHCLSLPEGIIMNPIINPIAMSVISITMIHPIQNHSDLGITILIGTTSYGNLRFNCSSPPESTAR